VGPARWRVLLELGDALAGAELGQPGPVPGGEGGVVLGALSVHQVGGVLDVAQPVNDTLVGCAGAFTGKSPPLWPGSDPGREAGRGRR
jgi:hypothetical protein